MKSLLELAASCPVLFLNRLKSLWLRLFESAFPTGGRFLGSKTFVTRKEAWIPLDECDGSHQGLSVLVSLYNFSDYVVTLSSSINSNACVKTTFHLIFVESSDDDTKELLDLLDEGLKLIVTRVPRRVGIYAAWNRGWEEGIKLGDELVTNLNADDLRRPRSLCCFAQHFKRSTASVVYGDAILIPDCPPNSWNSIPKDALQSQVGTFDLDDLIKKSLNKPHCAPMWRIRLREEVGAFNEKLNSSGDSEFWLRCLLQGVSFHYIPKAMVAYFNNPEGLSTKIGSRGFTEWNETLLRYCKSRIAHV